MKIVYDWSTVKDFFRFLIFGVKEDFWDNTTSDDPIVLNVMFIGIYYLILLPAMLSILALFFIPMILLSGFRRNRHG